MGMVDPIPTFSHIVSEIKRLHPKLAYLHLIEPRISGDSTIDYKLTGDPVQSNDFLREIWGDRPLISAGGFSREDAITLAERSPSALVSFGRTFIANVTTILPFLRRGTLANITVTQPDLPLRLKHNIPLNPYNRSTFYLQGNAPTGYIDQPFATQVDPIAVM
jgi:NADPH2 dehydrogenase